MREGSLCCHYFGEIGCTAEVFGTYPNAYSRGLDLCFTVVDNLPKYNLHMFHTIKLAAQLS